MKNQKIDIIENLDFLILGNLQNCKFLKARIVKFWWWINGVHMSHIGRKLSKMKLKWMNNMDGQTLAIQYWFSSF
jgi:hypothetical protein